MEDRWLRGVWRWAADRLRVRVGWNTAGRSNADARADLGLGVARGLKLAEQALDVVGGYPGVNRGRRELASDGVGAQIPGIDVIKKRLVDLGGHVVAALSAVVEAGAGQGEGEGTDAGEARQGGAHVALGPEGRRTAQVFFLSAHGAGHGDDNLVPVTRAAS